MTLGLAIVASLGLAFQAVPGTVEGVVRSADDGHPIPGAEIELVGTGRTSVADTAGRYVVEVSAGDHRLRAHRFGFAPLIVELSVPASGLIAVDFNLQVDAFPMPPVTIVDRRTPRSDIQQREAAMAVAVPAQASVRVLDTSPGVTELGITSGAQALLGPDPPAPDNVLYVRGAGASLDLVLLDGAPVHAPFHLGGLVEPGLPPSIQRAQRIQGGVTARYDGGLSDVLLLTIRPGAEGVHSMLFADMLAAGGSFESASSDVGALFISFRSLHNSWKGAILDSGLPQRYSDVLVRSDLFLAEHNTLSVTLFRNEETVRLGDESAFDEPRWGNTAGSVRYLTDTGLGRMELGAALGEFSTRLPVGIVDPLTATGNTRRTRVWADFTRQAGDIEVGYGLQGDHLSLNTVFREPVEFDETVRLNQRADAGAVGAWIEGRREISSRVDLKVGVRANFLTDGMGNSLSPRLLVGWEVAPNLRLTGSFGRFHQMVVTVDTDLPVETTLGSTADGVFLGTILSDVAAARSTHILLGVTHSPAPRELFHVEAFWKSSSGVPEFGNGMLRNAGIDVLIGRPLTPRISLWGAYSLAWAWASFPGKANQNVYSGRHFLRGGLTMESPGHIRLDANLSLGDGLEFGAIPRSERAVLTASDPSAGSTPAPSTPDMPGAAPPVLSINVPFADAGPIFTRAPNGSYLRLNFQVTGELAVRILGRDQTFLPYFRLVNALDRQDALFFRFDREDNAEPTPIGAVPILPVFGLEWRF